jgi:xylan 1,4-beta-xylosidase
VSAWLERIDDTHANAKRRWQAMGEPEYLEPKAVEQLHLASRLVPQPWRWTWRKRQVMLEVELPPHAVATLTLRLGTA